MTTEAARAAIGIIGGTGFYSLVESGAEDIEVETPYGAPSSPLKVGTLNAVPVAFLARHGVRHQYPPHVINYRANIWALRRLGVRRIVSVGAVGAFRRDISVGELVLCDQFVNRTWGRPDTFYDGPVTTHISMSEPYCAETRQILEEAGEALVVPIRDRATLLVIQGPRFSTKAENRDFRNAGYDLVSMTHYPEAVLARELGLCYASFCLVTDHATVLGDDEERPVSDMTEVLAASRAGHDRVARVIERALPSLASARGCSCGNVLSGARTESGWIPL